MRSSSKVNPFSSLYASSFFITTYHSMSIMVTGRAKSAILTGKGLQNEFNTNNHTAITIITAPCRLCHNSFHARHARPDHCVGHDADI